MTEDGFRFVCPFCAVIVAGPSAYCRGDGSNPAHPPLARPVFIEPGRVEEQVLAEARARYRVPQRQPAA